MFAFGNMLKQAADFAVRIGLTQAVASTFRNGLIQAVAFAFRSRFNWRVLYSSYFWFLPKYFR
jgi:hypothetical protein